MKTYSLGSLTCEHCSGMGFFRHGGFYDCVFKPCDRCKGLGQAYIDPQPQTDPQKKVLAG